MVEGYPKWVALEWLAWERTPCTTFAWVSSDWGGAQVEIRGGPLA